MFIVVHFVLYPKYAACVYVNSLCRLHGIIHKDDLKAMMPGEMIDIDDLVKIVTDLGHHVTGEAHL
jgi:hypothetical protein